MDVQDVQVDVANPLVPDAVRQAALALWELGADVLKQAACM